MFSEGGFHGYRFKLLGNSGPLNYLLKEASYLKIFVDLSCCFFSFITKKLDFLLRFILIFLKCKQLKVIALNCLYADAVAEHLN